MGKVRSHPVRLTPEDRELLTRVMRSGACPAQQVRRARVLLEMDEAHAEQFGVDPPLRVVVAERAGMSVSSVANIARLLAERGGDVEATITRKKRLTSPVPAKVTGDVEAAIIAMACSTPPAGFSRWSLRLLEKHIALVEDLPDLDHSTIGQVLRKRASSSPEGVLDDFAEGDRGVRRAD